MISFLRNLILSDFWLKLFSFVLAILIWLLVSFADHRASPTAEEVFIVPVQVTASDSDVRGYRADPKEVQVTVRGPARRLQNLVATEIRALVDLTGDNPQAGFHQPVEVIAPADVTLIGIAPTEVEVILPEPAKPSS